MLDIRLIREQPDFVKSRLATRGGDDAAKIDEVLRVDVEQRKAETALQQCNADRKRLSKEIGGKRAKGEATDEIEARVREIGIEIARLSEIDLVCRDGELATDSAPGLHVDLWSVKRCFVRNLDVIYPGILQNITRHLFGLLPKFWFIDKFLAELCGIVRRKAHQILFDAE